MKLIHKHKLLNDYYYTVFNNTNITSRYTFFTATNRINILFEEIGNIFSDWMDL